MTRTTTTALQADLCMFHAPGSVFTIYTHKHHTDATKVVLIRIVFTLHAYTFESCSQLYGIIIFSVVYAKRGRKQHQKTTSTK